MRIRSKLGAILLGGVVLCSCGPETSFKSARKAHMKGRHYEAWKKYQQFVASYPSHARAPESLFCAGLLAQERLQDCYMASTFYDSLLNSYPQSSPWAKAALIQKNVCPNYFPLAPGAKWTEGDSESKGGNARIEIECSASDAKALPNESGRLKRVFFAGNTKFKTTETNYLMKNSELREYPSSKDPTYKIVLRWPLREGESWTTKFGGQMFRYEVLSVDAAVSVAAGEFKNCLKVRSSVVGSAGSTFEYFAPGVGRVLTTLGTPSGEKRNTELLSYSPGPAFTFDRWDVQQ